MTEQQAGEEQGRGSTMVAQAPAQPVVPAMAAPQGGASTRRILLLNLLGLVVLLLIGLGIFYLWHQSYYFYSTDDATVSGNVVGVAAASPGTVISVDRALGDSLHAGDVVAVLRPPQGADIPLTSPINGTIIGESATPGAVLPAGQPVAQVVDLGALAVTAYVEETHIGDVQVGQGADITVDAVKSTTFHGRVLRILPATASTFSLLPTTDYASGNYTKVTQRVPVQIRLDSYAGYALYPGESAQVTLHIHS